MRSPLLSALARALLALPFVLALANGCTGRAPSLACVDDADCPTGFRCDVAAGACVLPDSEGEGEAGEGEGEAGEGEGEAAEGEGEGEGEGEALVFTVFERDPATPTVVAHETVTLSWVASASDAACTLTLPDGSERAVAFEGSAPFKPAIDGAFTVRCASGGETVQDTSAFDVVLPADIEASWDAALTATHPWRVDITFTAATARRAFPADVTVDLDALLAEAGVLDTASTDAVRTTAEGAQIDPYYSAATRLLFVPLPALAPGASTVVSVYFAPLGTAPWGEGAYLDDHAGPSAPIVMNRARDNAVALLDVNGFRASPFDFQELLYERGARVVAGSASSTTPVHAITAPLFTDVGRPPVLRVDNASFSLIEQAVGGPGGVQVVEVLTLSKVGAPAIRFTTALVNTSAAALDQVRFSTLMDLDVPGVFDVSNFSNRARAVGGVPVVCDNSGALCGALAGEASTGFRVGAFPGVSDDFVADNFIGVTDADFFGDHRLAVTWLLPSLARRVVLHSALAMNETINAVAAEAEAVANAEALAQAPATSSSPLWVRE